MGTPDRQPDDPGVDAGGSRTPLGVPDGSITGKVTAKGSTGGARPGRARTAAPGTRAAGCAAGMG